MWWIHMLTQFVVHVVAGLICATSSVWLWHPTSGSCTRGKQQALKLPLIFLSSPTRPLPRGHLWPTLKRSSSFSNWSTRSTSYQACFPATQHLLVRVNPAHVSVLLMCLSCSCVCPANVSVLPMCLSCECVCPANVSVLLMCLSCECVCPANVSVLRVCLSCACVCPAHVSVLPMCLSCQYVCPAHVSVLAGDTATWNITLALLTTSCGIMHASMSLLHSTSLFYHFPKSFPVQSLYLPFWFVKWLRAHNIPIYTYIFITLSEFVILFVRRYVCLGSFYARICLCIYTHSWNVYTSSGELIFYTLEYLDFALTYLMPSMAPVDA